MSTPFPSHRSEPPLVLVVEDFEDARLACVLYLQAQGYRVAEAKDGREALEKAAAVRPDVILMDLSIPLVDGWEVTRRLKSQEATRHIPVIALTAHTQDWHRRAALEAGCRGYLTKPFEPHSLLAEIDSALESPEPVR